MNAQKPKQKTRRRPTRRGSANAIGIPWNVHQLRITGFWLDPKKEARKPIWETIVSSAPEKVLTQPEQGSIRETGRWSAGILDIQQQADRIHLRLVSDPMPGVNFRFVPLGGLPPVGLFDDVLSEFVTMGNRWLSQRPSLRRLAFGSVLAQDVPNIESGNRALSSLLPLIKIPKNTEELYWGVNRPTKSKIIKGLRVNRLSRWTVTSAQISEFSQSATGLIPTADPTEAHALQVEFDISSDAKFSKGLGVTKLKALLGEFVMLSQEMARSGDRP